MRVGQEEYKASTFTDDVLLTLQPPLVMLPAVMKEETQF